MSNTVLKCHSLITSITINGVVKVPDGSGLITVASADAAAIMRGSQMFAGAGGPIVLSSPPIDPTT